MRAIVGNSRIARRDNRKTIAFRPGAGVGLPFYRTCFEWDGAGRLSPAEPGSRARATGERERLLLFAGDLLDEIDDTAAQLGALDAHERLGQ